MYINIEIYTDNIRFKKYKYYTFISIYHKYKKLSQVWLRFWVELDDIYIISIIH